MSGLQERRKGKRVLVCWEVGQNNGLAHKNNADMAEFGLCALAANKLIRKFGADLTQVSFPFNWSIRVVWGRREGWKKFESEYLCEYWVFYYSSLSLDNLTQVLIIIRWF